MISKDNSVFVWIFCFFVAGFAAVLAVIIFSNVPREDSLAPFVSCFDANVPGCSSSIPPSYSRCKETTEKILQREDCNVVDCPSGNPSWNYCVKCKNVFYGPGVV